MKKKVVPWWTQECFDAIKQRNQVFKKLRRTIIHDFLIDYQRKRAQARIIIKNAKREYRQTSCSSLGRETQIGEVWNMLKKMKGIYLSNNIPVLIGDGLAAVNEEEKAELLVQTLKRYIAMEM